MSLKYLIYIKNKFSEIKKRNTFFNVNRKVKICFQESHNTQKKNNKFKINLKTSWKTF